MNTSIENTWVEGCITVDGFQIHTYRTGGDKPPLVLAHSLFGSGRSWTSLVEALASDFDCVMFDARGHGDSSRCGAIYTEENRLQDLMAVISGLGLEHPGLVGHSMGGATVALAAARFPDLPLFLVLIDPALRKPAAEPSPEDTARQQASLAQGKQAFLLIQNGPTQAAQAVVSRMHPNWPAAEQAVLIDTIRHFDIELLHLFADLTRDMTPWQDFLGQIRCPTLLLSADPALNGVISPEQAQAMQSACPTLQWVQIPGAGHNLHIDCYLEAMAAIRQFINSLN